HSEKLSLDENAQIYCGVERLQRNITLQLSSARSTTRPKLSVLSRESNRARCSCGSFDVFLQFVGVTQFFTEPGMNTFLITICKWPAPIDPEEFSGVTSRRHIKCQHVAITLRCLQIQDFPMM